MAHHTTLAGIGSCAASGGVFEIVWKPLSGAAKSGGRGARALTYPALLFGWSIVETVSRRVLELFLPWEDSDVRSLFVHLTCLFLVSGGVVALSGQTLPDYDVRSSLGDGADTKLVAAPRLAALGGQVRAEFGDSVDLRFSLNESGAPRNLYRLNGVLAEGDGSEDAVGAARSFLARHRRLFLLQAGEAARLRVVERQQFGGTTLVRLGQEANGVPVWGGQLTITLDSDGAVVQARAGSLLSAAAPAPGTGEPRPGFGERAAVVVVMESAGVDAEGLGTARSSGEWRLYTHPQSGASPIAVRRVVFPLSAGDGRLAYQTYVDGPDGGSYEILVGAERGELLYRSNVASDMGSGRIWKRSPLVGDRELVEFGDGWLPADGEVTLGNNVDAFVDRNFDSAPDETTGDDILEGRAFSPTQTFDFAAGEGQTGEDPRDFAPAAIVSIFYHSNRSHDRFYALGFDEEAGNFQTDNMGLGGVGGDVMRAGAQAGSGASYSPRPEGVSPRLRTGVESNGTFDRTDDFDLAYDAQIVIHEYAHGVSSRLIGGAGRTDCLRTRIADGLSEGWSDYFAISFTNDPVLGNYDAHAEPGRGIRRQSYEGYTLMHQDLGNEGFQAHRDGEIWAATLWDVRKQLGMETTDQLVVDGLKLAPCNPSMVDAKDAVLMADQTRFDGANKAMLEEVFARHGLGFSSSSIDGFRLGESVTFNAAFDLPPAEGANRNPTIVGRIADPAEYQTPLEYAIRVLDFDGDPLTFLLVKGPQGLTVDEQGVVRWMVDRYAPQTALVEVTDGRGGRVLHGFTIPVITTLMTGQPVSINAVGRESGLLTFSVPTEQALMQVRLRGGEDSGNPGMFVFPPSPPLSSSFRFGANETLTFLDAAAGDWFIQVSTTRDFDDVTIEVVTPPIEVVESGVVMPGLAGVESSETFYRIDIPEGAESFTVSTAGGDGDVDLYLAKGRLPSCQLSLRVRQPCDFDLLSLDFGNAERITVTDEALTPALREESGRFAVEAGAYFLNLAAELDYSGASLVVAVDMGGGLPTISRGGVTHAANFGFFLAPGAIGTLFGTGLAGATAQADTVPLPTELGGVRVSVGGVDAPLYFVSETQINFQTPFEAPPNVFSSVLVTRDGAAGPFDELLALSNAPEIFTYNRVPDSRDPVIIHADGSLVSPENPARPNEVLIVFATGLGEVDNAPATGEASPASPLATLSRTAIVEIAGAEAEVLFAGLTPGFVGLAQFNIRTQPAFLLGGGTLPLSIRVQGFLSDTVNLFVTGPGGQ